MLNVTASNRKFCDLTGNFVNNLLKLIQQYLINIIILKFKNFENFIAKIQKILKIHSKNLKILLKIVLNLIQQYLNNINLKILK